MDGGNIRVRGCIKSCRTEFLEIKDASGKTNGCIYFFGLVTRLKRFHCTVDRLFGWTVQMKCDLSFFIVWSLFCFWISS